jgi:hypothetical protein
VLANTRPAPGRVNCKPAAVEDLRRRIPGDDLQFRAADFKAEEFVLHRSMVVWSA